MQRPELRVRPLPAAAILAAGIAFAALASLAAAGELVSMAAAIASGDTRLGWSGAGAAVIGVALVVAFIGGALRAAATRLTNRQLMLGGLALTLVVRAGVLVAVDSPLAVDGEAYRELARWLAAGNCCFADRPTGFPALLAPGYALFGSANWIHEALNLAFAVAGAWFVFDLGMGAFGRRGACGATAAYAVMPGLALLTPVLLTDTVYATLLLAACWSAVRMVEGQRWAAVAAGLLLAASQYVRPLGPALVAGLAAVLLLCLPLRRSLAGAVLMSAVFVLALTPVLVRNMEQYGDVSLSTSSYGGWSLYMGTKQRTHGRFANGVAAEIQALPGATLWERSEEAGRLAVARVASDPVGFAGLAVRKFSVMWGMEEHAVVYAFRPERPLRGVLAGVDLVAQLAYLALLVGVAGGLLVAARTVPRPPVVLLVVLAVVLTEAAVHTFLEVKPRYHAHLEPLLILAAAAITLARPASATDDAASAVTVGRRGE